MKDQIVGRELVEKVTRLEVIDSTGRAYATWDLAGVELHLQDDGRTLKIFASSDED